MREAMYPKIGDETSCARGNAETMRPVKALHDLRACGASFCFSGRACCFALACDLDQPCNGGLFPRKPPHVALGAAVLAQGKDRAHSVHTGNGWYETPIREMPWLFALYTLQSCVSPWPARDSFLAIESWHAADEDDGPSCCEGPVLLANMGMLLSWTIAKP